MSYETHDVATLCGVSVATVLRAIRLKQLKAERGKSASGSAMAYKIEPEAVLEWRVGPGWEQVVDEHFTQIEAEDAEDID